MTAKIISSATQADADLCNQLEPPTPGCNAGSGAHIQIPLDFVARIAAGQSVPGCTYARIEGDGSLTVSDAVQTRAADPARVPPPAKAATDALLTKLAISTAQVADSKLETP